VVIAVAILRFVTSLTLLFDTGIRPQLRCAYIQITDFQILAIPDPGAIADHCDHDRDTCQARPGETDKNLCQRPIRPGVTDNLVNRLLPGANVGKHHRHNHQIGENYYRHPDTGGKRQFANHANIDHIERQEADRVADQRDTARHHQCRQRCQCCLTRAKVAGQIIQEAVDDLHTMADRNGKHQEWHQH